MSMIDKIIGNFKITDFIEEGGMGKVYLARQLTIDREVAIKILDPSLSKNPQFKERFINEANALAKLNHTNIVSIYDFVEYEGNYCIIMEYVKGTTLDKIIEKFIPVIGAVFMTIGLGYLLYTSVWIHLDLHVRL